MSDHDTTSPGGHPRFLFVGGPGRSGTTLMGRTIGMHPLVSYLEESFLLFRYRQVHDITRYLYKDAWPDAQADKDALWRPGQVRRQRGAEQARKGELKRATHRTARRWLEMVIERLDIPKGVILDKTPRDVAHYAWGVEHLPRSRYLVMVRDPRAVVASRLEQEERRQDTGYVPGRRPTADVLERAEFWSRQWIDYLAIAEEAQTLDAERVLFVNYRDMLLDPVGVARTAQDFVGLAVEPSVTEYLETGGYREGLLTEQLDSWKDRLHKKVAKTVADTVGPRLEPFEAA